MSNLVEQFKKQFQILETKYKETDYMYVAVDIHETILKPTHSIEMSTEFYKFAKRTLQFMSAHKRIKLIIYTSTLPDTTLKYHEFFKTHGINFDFINGNNEIPSPHYADFSLKFFFNVLIEDKTGFDAENDWLPLYKYFFELHTGLDLDKLIAADFPGIKIEITE